jgi:hypothetical protein
MDIKGAIVCVDAMGAAFNILKVDMTKGSVRRKRLRACVDPKFRATLFAA